MEINKQFIKHIMRSSAYSCAMFAH